tara:strand:- start:442 stop:714 length:273 start_codon:yes stop_codon:yes gene_type:complete
MDILNSIEILVENEEGVIPRIELQEIMGYHESLTYDNSLTYKIFLLKRPDLSKEEVDIYKEIINRLENNDRIRYETAFRNMTELIQEEKT